MGKERPIGLFDSGVGGLTVAHALHTLMPAEQLIYFGDTAHLPYGDKSRETIVKYSLGISDFLLKQKCKVILIACNSASANAYDEVKEHVGDRAAVLNVIDPVVDHISEDNGQKRCVGIIGTKATIDSGTYEKKIAAATRAADMLHAATRNAASGDTASSKGPGGSGSGGSGSGSSRSVGSWSGSSGSGGSGSGSSRSGDSVSGSSGLPSRLEVKSLATPLFVPMIEEGFVFDDISNAIIRSYLSRKELQGIDSLILGCTHYPIIRNQISRYLNFEVNVLDSAKIVAQAVQAFLSEHNMLTNRRPGEDMFYVSDHTPYFEVIANMFFNEKIRLEKKNIWK